MMKEQNSNYSTHLLKEIKYSQSKHGVWYTREQCMWVTLRIYLGKHEHYLKSVLLHLGTSHLFSLDIKANEVMKKFLYLFISFVLRFWDEFKSCEDETSSSDFTDLKHISFHISISSDAGIISSLEILNTISWY